MKFLRTFFNFSDRYFSEKHRESPYYKEEEKKGKSMHHLKVEVKKEATISLKSSLEYSPKKNAMDGIIKDKSEVNEGPLAVKNVSSNKEMDKENVRFYSGNPAVEITEGIIHLYKNETRVPDEKTSNLNVIDYSNLQILN